MSAISTLNIDETKPESGSPTTQSVRANFSEIKDQLDNAKTDIEQLNIVSAESFGAEFDGVTDDSVAINAAIDSVNAAGGGIVELPNRMAIAAITMKSKVVLMGQHKGMFSIGHTSSTRLKAPPAGGDVISGGTVESAGIIGIQILGLGSSTACKGINITTANRMFFSDLNFNNISDEAIKIAGGTASVFKRVFAQNVLLDRTQAAKIGGIDIAGNDHFFDTMEITTSQSSVSDSNLYLCAFNIGGSNHFLSDLIGEISDIGIYLTCSNSRIVNCRADLNLGHGFQLDNADSNSFTNCSGLRNSQDTNDTYSQWEIESTSNSNRFTGCNADGLGSDSNNAKYGFNDALNSDSSKNTYYNCTAITNVTRQFNIVAFAGSAVSFPTGGPPKTFAAADATPSIEQYCFFKTGGADTYTDFDDHVPGQEIKILAVHVATLTHGTNIFTNTGATKVLTVNKIYTLRDVNGVWYEVE